MPRLPLSSREQIIEELRAIAADKIRLTDAKIIAPHRAAELRKSLDEWEHALTEQIDQMRGDR